MQYAIEYVENINKNSEVLKQINYVRLKKGVLLPCEVMGANGKMRTECCNNIEKLGPIKWDFEKIINAPVNSKQTKIWNEFIRWLRL